MSDAFEGLPQVAGESDITAQELEMKIRFYLKEEQEKIAPDNGLTNALCEAVRFARRQDEVQAEMLSLIKEIKDGMHSLRVPLMAEITERTLGFKPGPLPIVASGTGGKWVGNAGDELDAMVQADMLRQQESVDIELDKVTVKAPDDTPTEPTPLLDAVIEQQRKDERLKDREEYIRFEAGYEAGHNTGGACQESDPKAAWDAYNYMPPEVEDGQT